MTGRERVSDPDGGSGRADGSADGGAGLTGALTRLAGLGDLPDGQRDRVLTVPNALSLLRLAGVPLFLWLMLGPQADGWAIVVLVAGGITDWADGKLARILGQYSRVGALLDPAVDRLYILAALVGLGLRGIVPWWVVALLVARDLVLACCVLVLRSRGYGPFVVTYLGKAATFVLLYAFPLLLLGDGPSSAEAAVRAIAYAFAGWGVALYLWTGVLYLAQFVLALRRPVPGRSGPDGSRTTPSGGPAAGG